MSWVKAAIASSLFVLPAFGDGFEFLKQGKPAYARTAFRNQLKREPEDVESRLGLGLAELALGNADAAVEIFLAITDKKPKDATLRCALGKAFLLQAKQRIATGRDDDTARLLLMDARQQAERAATLDPMRADPWPVVARASLELRDIDRARNALVEAERLGMSPAERDEIEGAITYFTTLDQMDQGDEQSLASAQHSIEELLSRHPQSADLWLRLGDFHYNAGRFPQAFDCYEKSLLIDPFQRTCLEYLLADLAQPELRARISGIIEKTLDKAHALAAENDPRLGFPCYSAAQVHLAAREYTEAIPFLRKALAADSSLEIECQLGIADAQFRENKHDESCRAYLQAIHKNFDEVLARIRHLGCAELVAPCLIFHSGQCFKSGRLADARDLLAVAVELTPEDVGVVNNFAFLCRETGRYEESYRAYTRLLAIAPENPRYLNDCALILHYHLHRDLDQAEAMYRKAIDGARKLLDASDTLPAVREIAASALKDAEANLGKLLDKRR